MRVPEDTQGQIVVSFTLVSMTAQPKDSATLLYDLA